MFDPKTLISKPKFYDFIQKFTEIFTLFIDKNQIKTHYVSLKQFSSNKRFDEPLISIYAPGLFLPTKSKQMESLVTKVESLMSQIHPLAKNYRKLYETIRMHIKTLLIQKREPSEFIMSAGKLLLAQVDDLNFIFQVRYL